jgi:hypothetical protein
MGTEVEHWSAIRKGGVGGVERRRKESKMVAIAFLRNAAMRSGEKSQLSPV